MELALTLSIQPSHASSDHKPVEDAVLPSPDPSLHLHLLPLSVTPQLVNQNLLSSSNPFYLDVPRFEGEVCWSQCRGKRKKGSEEMVKKSNSSNREEEEEEEEDEKGAKVCSWKMMSDEEENGSMCRKKLRLSKEQSAFLEESFKEHHTLNPKQKLVLAKRLNLRPRQVEVWFQNRRARTKLKQTEVECEYLRRWCETLREENRKIQKEVQELRALKASQPFYMQVPATTLTICPSCDRTSSSRHPFHTLPDRLHL